MPDRSELSRFLQAQYGDDGTAMPSPGLASLDNAIYGEPPPQLDSQVHDTSNVLARIPEEPRGISWLMRSIANNISGWSPPAGPPQRVNTLTGREQNLTTRGAEHNIPLLAEVLGVHMPAGALNTAANWLDWNPEIGPDTLAPTGMAMFGAAPAGALAAGAGRRRPPTPAVSRMEPGPQGRHFDLSNLHEVPDVPQAPLPRYEPPRGVPERASDLVANRRVRAELGEVMDEGALAGGPRWYNAEPLRQAFVDELGPRRGPPAFQQYMDMVAATSPRSRVPDNIRNASYYYSLLRRGEPMPAIGTPNPAPYGHLAQRLHQQNAATVATGGGWDALRNPKPASFAANLAGNQLPGTIDAHATNLPAMMSRDPRWLATTVGIPQGGTGGWEYVRPQAMHASGELSMREAGRRPTYWAGMPNNTEYGTIEGLYQHLARERGLTTAGGQASAWLAGGRRTGLGSPAEPWMKTFEDVLLRTALERGQRPSAALRDFIRGRAALLADLELGSLPGSLTNAQEQQQRLQPRSLTETILEAQARRQAERRP